jgi:polysaccharide biosynthesis transport protein
MKKNISLVSNKNNNRPFLESYRTLATSIRSCQPDKHLKTLLITSAREGEGKSTVTVNLGIVFAEAGNKVLLVDTDLRSPSLHDTFQLNNSSGLSNILLEVYNSQISNTISEDFSIGDIFQLLMIQKKTGILTAEQNDETVIVSFQEGKMVDVVWRGRPAEKRLGNILIKTGKITSEILDEALQKQQETSKRLGYVLVNLGSVEPQDLEGPLKLHVTEGLWKVFGFKNGTFTFHETRSLDYDKDIFDVLKIEQAILVTFLERHGQPFIEKEIASFIRDTNIENLKLLPSGSLPPNPPELLASERMRVLVKILQDKFDIIIFDSPPATIITDASVLASFLDGVILVIQNGMYDRRIIQKAKESLDLARANIYGVVLNQVDLSGENYYADYLK